MKKKPYIISAFLIFLLCLSIDAQTTAFTYQGNLTDGGNPANGNFQMQFKLFDAVSGGTQIGSTISDVAVTAANGVFKAQLDFGASAFTGSNRWLEIAVRHNSGETYVTLSPREQIASSPYAVRTLSAAAADSLAASCVGCVTSSQIASVNGNTVTGTIPLASVPAASPNYIQNSTSPQAASNFNISGSGTVAGTLTGNIVNAVNQVNINGLRAFTVNGAFSSERGVFPASNTFTGEGAGINTTPSSTVTDFEGKLNAFYGVAAGKGNTTGCCNSFFGNLVAVNNTTGRSNAFFGGAAGYLNTTGSYNAFFGDLAGYNLTTGGNTTGNYNTAVGFFAGSALGTGSNNTLLGAYANASGNLTNATAIGANASVSQSNSLILGNGVNVGIGTTAPGYRLDVIGGVRSLDSVSTHFVAETTGGTNSWARIFMRTPNRGWFIGTSRGFLNDQFHIWDETANQIRMAIDTGGNVGIGTVAPGARLHVQGNVFVSGTVTQGSDARLKQNISKLEYGLSEVLRLRPVAWRWKAHPESGEQLGLVAQEVESVLPELVSTSKDAEQTKGLNYIGLVPILVNAVKEQQQQLDEQVRLAKELQLKIERQDRLLKRQRDQLAELKALVCLRARKAAQCR